MNTEVNKNSLQDHPGSAARLESLIGALTEIHERLLVLTGEHRNAVRSADSARVADCVREQRELIARIGQLDQDRRALIAEMLPGVPAREVTLTRLSQHFAGQTREKLENSAAQLRDLICTIARENRSMAEATATLMGHMEGMVRQIASSLSKSGTYGRCGSVRADARIPSGIDVSH